MNIDFVTQGKILGAQVYKDSSMVVQAVLDQEYRATLSTRDIETIWIALALVGAVVLYQLWIALMAKRRGNAISFGKWLRFVVLDLIVFVGIIALKVYVDYKILKIEYPKQVVVERLGEDLVRVRWQTYDETMGIMIWEYEGEEGQFAIDDVGEEKRKEHEIFLTVDPQKIIRFYLVVGERKFGQTETEPYQVDKISIKYQLEDIQTQTSKNIKGLVDE